MSSSIYELTGGGPWGFKMTGGRDFHQPLTVGKVTVGGKAARSGVVEGYCIERVNGENMAPMTHHEALQKIKNAGFTLVLQLSKGKPRAEPPPQTFALGAEKAASRSQQNLTSTVASKTNFNANKLPNANQSHSRSASHSSSSGELENAPARGMEYDPSRWQSSKGVAQSRSLEKVNRRLNQTKYQSEEDEAPTVEVTPDIAELILEEEREERRKREQQEAQKNHENLPSVNCSTPATATRPAAVELCPASQDPANRNRALGNISKFIQDQPPSRYGEPEFTKHLVDVRKPLGDPVVLEVRLGPNLPKPTVHWYHNSKPARESKEKDLTFLSAGNVHTLVLGELTSDQVGTYTCTIVNKYGSKSSRCRVAVDNDVSNGGGFPAQRTSSYNNTEVYSPPPPTTTLYTNQPPPRRSPSPLSPTRNVVASTSLGLYSSRNVDEVWKGQAGNLERSGGSEEESEVLKALREDSPTQTAHQSRSMKYLESTLLNEEFELPESEDL